MKSRSRRDDQLNMALQVTIRRGASPHIKAGSGNPIGGKVLQAEAKESGDTPTPIAGSSTRASSYTTIRNAEGLAQAHRGSTTVASVSVTPSEPLSWSWAPCITLIRYMKAMIVIAE